MRLSPARAAPATPASLRVRLRLDVVGGDGIQRLVETCDRQPQCYLCSPRKQLKCHLSSPRNNQNVDVIAKELK